MTSAVTFKVFPPVKEDGLGGEGARLASPKRELLEAIQVASALSSVIVISTPPLISIHWARGTSGELEEEDGRTGEGSTVLLSARLIMRHLLRGGGGVLLRVDFQLESYRENRCPFGSSSY
jgi:hypothetical protein